MNTCLVTVVDIKLYIISVNGYCSVNAPTLNDSQVELVWEQTGLLKVGKVKCSVKRFVWSYVLHNNATR